MWSMFYDKLNNFSFYRINFLFYLLWEWIVDIFIVVSKWKEWKIVFIERSKR